jgi:DNA repair protein RAD57
MDLEAQDHILNYQLPVALANYNVSLVIIDSITSNYRAEHSSNNILAISTRSTELAKLGQMLRNLAAKENIAVVLANQVSDRFEPAEGIGADPAQRSGFPSILSQGAVAREAGAASPLQRTRSDNTDQLSQFSQGPSSSQAIPSSPYHAPDDEKFDGSYIIENPARNSILSLVHQERFFTGWGDGSPYEKNLKTPALGYFWSTQIACRIALKKEERRSMAAPWARNDTYYPVSTPTEKEDSQENSVAGSMHQHGNVISSARDAHAAKADEDSKLANEKDQPSILPKKEAPSQRPMEPPAIEYSTRRTMKLVFAPWTAGAREPGADKSEDRGQATDRTTNEVEFELWKGGLRSIRPEN